MIRQWQATLSVNAGLCLQTEGLSLWLDALHDEQVPGFSTLSPALQQQVLQTEAFGTPDFIAFTHCHPDHFSEALCCTAMMKFPSAKVVLPEQRFHHQLRLCGRETLLTHGEQLLTFHRLTHEGEDYAEVPHYGLMIEDCGERILIPGDCAIANPELADWVADCALDTVFLPFPWITLPAGRHFINEVLRPKLLMIYHLPLSADDCYGYRRAAQKAADKLRPEYEVCLFTEPFQRAWF